MEQYPAYSPETEQEVKPNRPGHWLLFGVVVLVLAVGLGYSLYAQRLAHREFLTRMDEVRADLSLLQARANTLELNYADLRAHADITAENVARAAQDLSRTRRLTRQFREQQNRNVAELTSELKQHESQLGSLAGDVGSVKTQVEGTRQDLETTKGRLERTVGDLGMQSGLIARTREELEVLKRRGERDYFEFDLHRSNQFTRVGDVAVRLRKVDAKRGKYTLTLAVNHRHIDKKDRTIYEPVQFYPERGQSLFELVVFEMGRDRVAGYLSAPKELSARRSGP